MAGVRMRNAFFSLVRAKLSKSQVVQSSLNANDSSGFSRSCAGLIFAKAEKEVAHVIRAANRFSIPIRAVSTGSNVGYGDFFPEHPDHVVLDLRGMNKILELNREERWLRIEAGVTQGQVETYLKKRAPEFSFDLTSWLKETSVVGNALERGRTLFSDREKDLIGAKWIAGSGEVLRTGFDPKAKSPLRHGPNLHPLIFQSNLGVVVEGVLRLHRRDETKRYWLAGFKKNGEAMRAAEALEKLAGVRALRWFCAESFKAAPVSSTQKLKGMAGGVLVFETSAGVSPAKWRKCLPRPAVSIRREDLNSTSAIPKDLISFVSFAVRRSYREMARAQKLIRSLDCPSRVQVYQTISYAEGAQIILLRLLADPAQHLSVTRVEFKRVSVRIQKSGYVLFRDHSALPTKNLPAARLNKMIKHCFDPKGIIAPGRYGLR
jgi:hypothetical protein